MSRSEPVFRKMNDDILCLKDVLKADINLPPDETIYPLFINEAAYYEKDMAFGLTIEKHIPVSAMKIK